MAVRCAKRAEAGRRDEGRGGRGISRRRCKSRTQQTTGDFFFFDSGFMSGGGVRDRVGG